MNRIAIIDDSTNHQASIHPKPRPRSFDWTLGRRRTIGIRVPSNNIVRDLVAELNQPLLSSTLIMPGDTEPLTDPYEIRERLEHTVDLIIDGGHCGVEATTVVDLTGSTPVVMREGKGDAGVFK